MRLLAGGEWVVRSSGATLRGQVWRWDDGTMHVWDGVNWYDAEAFILTLRKGA